MFVVKLFIEQTNKGLQRQDGQYGYVLAFENNGKTIIREAYEMIQDATAHQTELVAVTKALNRLTKECQITIYSAHGFFKSGFTRRWVEKWQVNDWKNAKGEPVANREEWEKLLLEMAKHSVTVGTVGEHIYSIHMLHEMKKRKGE